MAKVNLSVNVGESKKIIFHSGGTYNTEDIVFDVSANGGSGYKPVQTAVSDPTASTTASTTFIDTISQNTNGVITATKKNLPTASTTVAGITKVGASGGAAAYSHNHTTSIATSTGTNQITLAFGTKYAISAGGTSYVFTMPANPNTNTTYKFDTGDGKGQIKVTPSSGDVYNVSVKGLGSAAYTDSSDYATSGHTHATSITTSSGTNQITLAFGTKYSISTGGTNYVFTMPSLPTATSSVAGIATLGASGGSATYDHTHGSITNAGAIADNTTIANGDHLVITDTSDSNKIKRASITFGTSPSTYLRNDGKWGTPSTSTPLATPLFDGDVPGIVIPIAATNEIAFRGDPITYNASPSLLFPSASSTFALPIFMDKAGHLLMLIPDSFANHLIDNFKYSTVP